jgi:hypothetical protein
MAVKKFGASERFACKIIGQNRSAFWKKKPDPGFEETRLRGALRAIAVKHPAWGWRKARWHLLAQQWAGMALNSKRVRRLWREEGLVCKPKARKKRRTGPGAGKQKRLTAEYPMHVVSFDFQSDVTSCGRGGTPASSMSSTNTPAPRWPSSRAGRSQPPTWSQYWKTSSPKPAPPRATSAATTVPNSPPH